MISLLEFVICFQGAGNFLMYYKLFNEISYLDVGIVIYGLIFAMMPWQYIIDYFMVEKSG